MSRAQMTAPFAEEELRTFKGRGGKTMTFIEDETVMDRLDAGYGFGNWQILVEPVPSDPGVVKVRLGVREHGEWTWYEDFGYPNQPDGDVLKEAVSDGIRRCGRYVGIARDLYRKSTYEPGGALGPPVAQDNAHPRPAPEHLPPRAGSLIGVAEAAKAPHDFEVRQGPDGPTIGFALKEGRDLVRVIASGQIASEIAALREAVEGKRVTCYGSMVPDKWTIGKGTAKERDIPYIRLSLTRLTGGDGLDLPLPIDAPTEPLGLMDPEFDAAMARVP